MTKMYKVTYANICEVLVEAEGPEEAMDLACTMDPNSIEGYQDMEVEEE